MSFIVDILDVPKMSPLDKRKRFDNYYAYLQASRNALPRSAYEFAIAEWHYDFGDSRSLHDAWLEGLRMDVTASGRRSQNRQLDIGVRLLGARHDGYINLHYAHVYDFIFTGPFDCYYDEIRLAGVGSGGRVVHEIRGSATTHWVIVCDDMSYKWEPTKVEIHQ